MIVVLELMNNNEGLTQYGFLFLSFVFPDQLKPHSVSGEGGGEGGEEGEVVLVGWGGRQGEGGRVDEPGSGSGVSLPHLPGGVV